MDTESLDDRVRDAYAHGPDAVIAAVGQLLSALVGQVETLATRVAALEEENAALRAKLVTTSRNNGKPPSSDGPDVRPQPKSQRTTGGRSPGSQPGHVGASCLMMG